MIPASYLFRGLYRSRFEPPLHPEGEEPVRDFEGEAARRQRFSAAVIGFAFGAPAFILGASRQPQPDARCR